MRKRLLLTTDDFGMCHAVNAGTLRAMRSGVAASSNFLVPCPWFGFVGVSRRRQWGELDYD